MVIRRSLAQIAPYSEFMHGNAAFADSMSGVCPWHGQASFLPIRLNSLKKETTMKCNLSKKEKQ